MKKILSFVLAILLTLSLFVSCTGKTPDETDEKTVSDSTESAKNDTDEVTTQDNSEKNTEESSDDTEQMTEKKPEGTMENPNIETPYVDPSSVQTVFSFGEKFNCNGIKVVYYQDGVMTEYPEDDLYIENEPKLTAPGTYSVTVEILPIEETVSYEITVKDIDAAAVCAASVISVNGNGSYRCEVEDIDFTKVNTTGKLIIDDSYASGGKYVSNYGKVGNTFGFTVISDSEQTEVTLVLRMANFAVTMLYPYEHIKIYQNYKSINENTPLPIDPSEYLTTRAPSLDDQEGADTSLVWCEVRLEGINLNNGENTFLFTMIGPDAPFFDCIDIIVP